jgi:hypothetical protein
VLILLNVADLANRLYDPAVRQRVGTIDIGLGLWVAAGGSAVAILAPIIERMGARLVRPKARLGHMHSATA